MDSLDELRILRVVDVRTERDLVDGQFARYWDALRRHDLIWFVLNVLWAVHEFLR